MKPRKDPETYAELARLLAHLGEHEKSTAHYQQALLMTTSALPDLPLPEQDKNNQVLSGQLSGRA